MSNLKRIEAKLRNCLNIEYLDLIDDSHDHANHYDKGDDVLVSHLTIVAWSKQFENLSLIKQHKLINDAIFDEFDQGLHALQIKIKKPKVCG